jgi:hypothetical protein
VSPMQVACLHLPRPSMSLDIALRMTKFNHMACFYMITQLDELSETGSEPFALELFATGGSIRVCIAASPEMIKRLSNTIYSYYPDIEIHEHFDYTKQVTDRTVTASADLRLAYPSIYPIQTFKSMAWHSMAPLFASLSRVGENDRALIQMVVHPIKDTNVFQAQLATARYFDRFLRLFRPRTWLKADLPNQTAALLKDKALARQFRINYRVAAWAEPPKNATAGDLKHLKARVLGHVRNVSDAVKVMNTLNENRFEVRPVLFGKPAQTRLQQRQLIKPFRFSGLEVSSMWHPPGQGNVPNTELVLSRKAPASRSLPCTPNDPQISFIGTTNFRNQNTPFGIRRFDRRRHLYVLGKSGNGKSCLIQLLAKSDLENGFGCAVLDPHGDLVDDILRLVPKHRVKDVVIFDPSDIQNPPSFNPMVPVNNEHKMRVVLGFLDTFKKVFDKGWSEKMDHLLRYAMIALLNVPGASIVSLRRLLSDDDFRNEVMKRNDDEAVRRFWEVEFTSRRQEFEEGPVSQLLNRLDELLATDMIRNVLGQPGNSFDFRDFIDNRKIVLFKLSKGIIGSENASFLGSLVIWKLYEAAMSRADTAMEARQDFYFYIDEFQNFATSSFGEILSESRKYRLCLTFANQFLQQMPDGVKNTVFGNVANLICFRVGAEDAVTVSNEFKPRFAPEDVLNLALREFYVKMSVDGEVQEAFSARTIDLYHPHDHQETVRECIAHSRATYAMPVNQAEEQLALSEIMSPRAMRAR